MSLRSRVRRCLWRSRGSITVAALVLGMVPTAAAAQSFVVSMPIQDVLLMNATSTLTPPASLTSTRFSASAATPAASTYVPYGGRVVLDVAANRAFAVTISGVFTGPGAKPATDALWSTTQNVFTNTARNVSGTNAEANRTIPFPGTQPSNAAWVQNVYVASRWVYETDRSGTYNLTLTFTLAAK